MVIPLLLASPLLQAAAYQLATAFQLPLVEQLPIETSLFLQLTAERLELQDQQTKIKPIYVDFIKGKIGYRRNHGGGRQQALAKAIGLKRGATPTVIDATAGLGREAFILADLGCDVWMIERSPVIAALLHDGLQRAQQDFEIGALITQHLHFVHDDAQHWLCQLSAHQYPQVIYLDPMYPPRHKSALVKKEMRLFRQIVGEDSDAPQLLTQALTYAQQRVVVKRPQWAPPLGNYPAAFKIRSENTRFDIYIP
jgi:16S rRNA (guanine1516-N2)-methyltransferase